MTREEFQKKYHNYQTHSEEEAKREAGLVNEQGIEGGIAVAVSFGDLGWCLMLQSAIMALIEIGLYP